MTLSGISIVVCAVGAVVVAANLLGVMPHIATTHPIQPLAALGIFDYPDKLGWMDDEVLSAADTRRVAQLSGAGYGSDEGVITAMQSGARGEVDRRDFELLRQDRRRAQAAYPDVSPDDLYAGAWVSVGLSAKVPDTFCT